MGRFAAKYTEDQKKAIALGQVDDGLTAQQAVEHALEGTLRGLEPFEMKKGYASWLATEERKIRQGKKTHPAVAKGLQEAKRYIVEKELNILARSIDRIAETSGLEQDDAELLASLAKTQKLIFDQADTLTQPHTPQASGSKMERPNVLAQHQSELAKALATEHKAEIPIAA